jgi:hypothetical protein
MKPRTPTSMLSEMLKKNNICGKKVQLVKNTK